jgi:hypothetical protein
MKHTIAIIVVLCAFVARANAFPFPADNKFVGTSACKPCHNADKTGKQYAAWEKTGHAKAFKTLQTPEADKIAAKKGIKGKAADAAECQKCHVTGMLDKAPQYDAKFSKDEGVGCEECHGAGSAYKALHAKKENLDKAKAAGMVTLKAADGSAEKQCKTCHNEKSPTYKAFKFKDMWAKIAHPLPKK